VITNFVAGNTVTFPMFVWGAAQRGIPPQVNVMATLMFVVALGATTIGILAGRRR
jgi:spermidine/putrescine transport system permease protein